MSRPASRPESSKLENRLQVVFFGLFLVLPLIGSTVDLDRTPPVNQRVTSKLPAPPADLGAVASWPEQFDDYYRDHFGWRNGLIRHFHQLNFWLFRVADSRRAMVGKSGWIYYGHHAADYQRGNRPFSRGQEKRWLESIDERARWLEERGIHYLFTVAPNKHSIYPEHLPAKLTAVDLPTRYQQLLASLRTQTEVTVVDLHQPLIAAKSQAQIYERTGSHWNARGAYVAYGEIFGQLARWFPGLEKIPFSRIRMERRGSADLAHMLGLEEILHERRSKPVGGVKYAGARIRRNETLVTEQDDPTLPRAVIFHDSFFVSLAPYLSEHFSYAVYQWRARFDGELVLRVQPDIVIEERVERRLMQRQIPNTLPRVGIDATQRPEE